MSVLGPSLSVCSAAWFGKCFHESITFGPLQKMGALQKSYYSTFPIEKTKI